MHVFRELVNANVKFIPLEDSLYFIESKHFDGLEFAE